jgi:hypothetical protein
MQLENKAASHKLSTLTSPASIGYRSHLFNFISLLKSAWLGGLDQLLLTQDLVAPRTTSQLFSRSIIRQNSSQQQWEAYHPCRILGPIPPPLVIGTYRHIEGLLLFYFSYKKKRFKIFFWLAIKPIVEARLARNVK